MYKHITLVVALCTLLSCSIKHDESTESKKAADKKLSSVENIQLHKPYLLSDMPYSNKIPKGVQERGEEWLTKIKVGLQRNTDSVHGVKLKAILEQLNKDGLRLTSTLPTDQIFYRGFNIPADTDALTALRIITVQMGADFIVHNEPGMQPYVSIVEMGSDYFTLNVPDVEMGLSIVSSSLGNISGSGSEGGTSGTSGGQVGGTSSNANSGSSNSGAGTKGMSTTTATYESKFWSKLEEQLEALMQVPMPVIQEQSASSGQGGFGLEPNTSGFVSRNGNQRQGQNSQSFMNLVTVGRVVVNSSTGYVVVTAPRHIRRQVIDYLTELDVTLNTRLEIKAELISLTVQANETKGIDLNGFKAFYQDRYNVSLSNSVLGNITTATTDGFTAVADGALSPTLFGVQKADQLFSAFAAYLSTFGETSVVADIDGSTRSGRTFNFKRQQDIPRIETSTQNTSSDGVGSTSSNTETVYDTTGTFASITPSYDIRRGLVNTIVDIELILNDGEIEFEEPIISDGTIEFRTTKRLKTSTVNISTEAPSRVGEVFIIGGYESKDSQDREGGITKLKDSNIGGLFGNSNRSSTVTRLYVLLSVNPVRHDNNAI